MRLSLADATRGLKTIGCKTNTSCETPLDATEDLKTIGFKKRWEVRLQNTTSTIGSFADGIRETGRDALKPLVWWWLPVVRQDEMP